MISSGFFNSIKHDRRYNALQFGSIYDGVIRDGIFMSIGTCFQITESDPNSMNVIIGEGRAWFDHSWILNDAPEPLLMPQSELLLDRIDAIVIETNHEEAVRRNSIKVVSGEPSDNPQKPVLIRNAFVNQYPLAYVKIKADSVSIRQADIENAVGSEPCPFVTGILETIDTTMLVAQWKDEWELIKDEWGVDWEKWSSAKLEEIQNWFEFVKDTLGEDAAVGLANKLYELQQKMDLVVSETLDKVSEELESMKQTDLNLSLENQNLKNALAALETKVNNAIGSGDLAAPYTLDMLTTPYSDYGSSNCAITAATNIGITAVRSGHESAGAYCAFGRRWTTPIKVGKKYVIKTSTTNNNIHGNGRPYFYISNTYQGTPLLTFTGNLDLTAYVDQTLYLSFEGYIPYSQSNSYGSVAFNTVTVTNQ